MYKLTDLYKQIKEEHTQPQYEIYCDLDQVLSDFNGQFEKYGKMPPKQYEAKFGKDKFWNLIDKEVGVKFWSDMPWTGDGKELWNHIKQYNPKILSAPSRENESRLGKRIWINRELPGTKLILSPAWNKKDYARSNRILIDDNERNVEEWIAAGGKGIIFINTPQTIKELEQYGL